MTKETFVAINKVWEFLMLFYNLDIFITYFTVTYKGWITSSGKSSIVLK